jgi:5-methylcytosine-specific restriction endonuclease McrA
LPDCRLRSRSTGGEYPDRRYPTIDHIVPLSVGGTDTRDNVQIAHLFCNLSKGANRGAPEQLRLVG